MRLSRFAGIILAVVGVGGIAAGISVRQILPKISGAEAGLLMAVLVLGGCALIFYGLFLLARPRARNVS